MFISAFSVQYPGLHKLISCFEAYCATCVKNPEGQALGEEAMLSSFATCFTTNTLRLSPSF